VLSHSGITDSCIGEGQAVPARHWFHIESAASTRNQVGGLVIDAQIGTTRGYPRPTRSAARSIREHFDSCHPAATPPHVWQSQRRADLPQAVSDLLLACCTVDE